MSNSWEDLKLSAEALDLIQKAGFAKPTPVQGQCIPIVLEGRDLIGTAQTGTGKTATFTLPMVERFAGRKGTYGLVLAPTREIAQQTQATFELFGKPRGVQSIVLIGGINMKEDEKALATYPQVIVATPGRLCDHLDRGNIWLDFIEMVVLDEADRMLDMGFTDQLNRIMQDVPAKRQTLLFSATMTQPVEKLARKIMHEPARIAIGAPQSTATRVEQYVRHISEDQKNSELRRIIREEPGSIIVFTRSKMGATKVWRSLHSSGIYDATYIHSDRLQSHREQALAEFKEGKYRILIATDVAARGIHVEAVAHVVNYDLPMEPEDYVHRIGRTGRAGASGRATTFITPRDRGGVKQIEKLIGKSLSDAPAGPSRAEGGAEGAPESSRREMERSQIPAPLQVTAESPAEQDADLQEEFENEQELSSEFVSEEESSEEVRPEEIRPEGNRSEENRNEARHQIIPRSRIRTFDHDRDLGRRQKTFFPIDAPPPPPLSARGLYSGTSTPWSTKIATPWREEGAPRPQSSSVVRTSEGSRSESEGSRGGRSRRRRRRGGRSRGPSASSGDSGATSNTE